MHDPRFSVLAVDLKASALLSWLDNGWLNIFDGERPDGPDENVGTQVLLARLQLGAPAFTEPSNGCAAATPVEPSPALASGRPTWFRLETKDGTALIDGTVGGSWSENTEEAFDFTINGDIEAEGLVRVERLVYREQKRWS